MVLHLKIEREQYNDHIRHVMHSNWQRDSWVFSWLGKRAIELRQGNSENNLHTNPEVAHMFRESMQDELTLISPSFC